MDSALSLGDSQQKVGLEADEEVGMNLVSGVRVRGSEYPSASQGARPLFGVLLDSPNPLDGVFSGDGVATTLEHAELPPTAEGVGVCSIESLLMQHAVVSTPDAFNSEVTSILSTLPTPNGRWPRSDEAG